MKNTLLSLSLLAGAAFAPLSAASFDVAGFGGALNGFHPKWKTAKYAINAQNFVTTQPTVTYREDGGLFITCNVHAGKCRTPTNVGVIEINVTSWGELETGQLRLTVNGRNITTALVERPPNEAPPVDGLDAGPNLQPWRTSTNAMVNTLFADLNQQINKLDPEEKGTRDLYTRFAGQGNMLTHFPAALRHNLNLLLKSVD